MYNLFKQSVIGLLFSGLLGISMSAQNLPKAVELSKAMTLGWNLGNTMEAIGGETAWGNPLTTQRLIDSVKAAGFNTIRIPCAWDNHANQSTLQIDAAWLKRVKEIVDYCIKRDLYVIINIHWDNGWLENNCTDAMKNSVNSKQNSYWTQIANYFKNYDGHLLFASANEPAVENAAMMNVLMSYHQTFINAVRATGGNNSSRVLIVQGPTTDIDKTNQLIHSMPTDQIPNRLMVEIHYYTPYQFCLMTEDANWGSMFYYWGKNNHSTTDAGRNPTWGEEAALDTYFQSMKTKFVDKGIPVIIGEFAAIKRTNLTGAALALHLKSREYYLEYLAKAAVKNGLIPIYWDPGFIGNNSTTLFNRNTGAIVDRSAVNALIKGMGIVVTVSDDVFIGNDVELYPNPFTSSLEFSHSASTLIQKIVVFDLAGNVLETIQPLEQNARIVIGSYLKSGSYVVQVYDEKGTHYFKVIKN